MHYSLIHFTPTKIFAKALESHTTHDGHKQKKKPKTTCSLKVQSKPPSSWPLLERTKWGGGGRVLADACTYTINKSKEKNSGERMICALNTTLKLPSNEPIRNEKICENICVNHLFTKPHYGDISSTDMLSH